MPDPIRKIALSRHAVQRLAAHPELATEADVARAARAPFSADEMARALAGSLGDDEAALKRRLRRLRERVLLRTMARDLEGLAGTVPGGSPDDDSKANSLSSGPIFWSTNGASDPSAEAKISMAHGRRERGYHRNDAVAPRVTQTEDTGA